MYKRILVVAALVLVGAFSALAESDVKALDQIRTIRQGKDNADQIKTLRVSGAGTVGGALTVTGATTLNGGLTVVGAVTGTSVDATKLLGNEPLAVNTNWLATAGALTTNTIVSNGGGAGTTNVIITTPIGAKTMIVSWTVR